MAKGKTLVTPRGLARFLCLDNEEVINNKRTGKKSASIVLSDENLKAMAAVVEDFKDENLSAAQVKRFRSPFATKDGQTWIKAKTRAFNEDGTDKVVPIFDAKGNPVKGRIKVGNGSAIRLNVTMNPYDMTTADGQKMAGITFYLNSVQVIRLVKFQSGFDDESEGEEGTFDAGTSEFEDAREPEEARKAASGPVDQADLDDEIPF